MRTLPQKSRKLLAFFVLSLLTILVLSNPASAFNSEFDAGGHTAVEQEGMPGVAKGDRPGSGDVVGDGSPNKCGSPFEVATGNFIHSSVDVALPALGPDIVLRRTYNALDFRTGPFGHGWSFSYDQRLIETTDEVQMYAICRQGNGKRERYVRNSNGTYTSPAHLFSTLTKNANGSFTLREKNGFQRRFNTDGRLEAMLDRNGNTVKISYDATGFPTTITDTNNRKVTLTKGGNGKVASITDYTNRTFRYVYDAEGNLVEFRDPLGSQTQYRYDADHRLLEVIDPRGNTVQQMTYDSEGRLATVFDQEGTATARYFPDENKTTKTISPFGGAGAVWTYFYNDNGNILKTIDPLGNTIENIYDAHLDITGVIDENGNTTRRSFDSLGNLTSITDGLGRITRFTYEPNFQQLATITEPLGQTTRLEYDAKGNLTKITNVLNQVTQLAYDQQGQLISLTDPLNQATRFVYDTVGNLSQQTDPLGQSTSMTYDNQGNLLSITNAEGHVTTFVYDLNNRVTEQTDALGVSTTFAYDPSGNLETVTDGNGNTTTFEYGTMNRLAKIVNALGKRTKLFSYDTRGRLTFAFISGSQRILYTYDDLNRMTRRSIDNELTTDVTYDKTGNVLTLSTSKSNLSFVYDKAKQVVGVRTGATAIQPATTIAYAYDANGNRTKMTDPQNGETTYVYDALNRLESLTNPKGKTILYTFDALSRRAKMTYPNNTTTTFEYDANSQLKNLVAQASGVTLSRFDYVYDQIGNRTSITDLAGVNTYTYDVVSRLTGATHPPSTSPNESFTLDPVGNRIISHLSSTHTHDAANRLLKDDGSTYVYLANGNLVRKTDNATGALTRYTYDSDQQLTKIQFPDQTTATYEYDVLGRRIQKNVRGQITRYIYDGEDILQELDGSNTLQARYTHGPGIDEPLIMDRQGQSFFYHADGLGSIVALSNASGSPVQPYRYDSYGTLVNQSGTIANPYTYTGREYDEESGLYYYRARYYNSSLGRFMSEDPVGFGGGDSNLYRYVNNNPVNLADPTGLQPGTFEKICEIVNRGMSFNGAAGTLASNGATIAGAEFGIGLIGPDLIGGSGGGIITSTLLGCAIGSASGVLPGCVVGFTAGAFAAANCISAKAVDRIRARSPVSEQGLVGGKPCDTDVFIGDPQFPFDNQDNFLNEARKTLRPGRKDTLICEPSRGVCNVIRR